MPLSAGTRFGPYEIVSPIGAGGMGEVYKAQDSRLKRFVAIKVLAGTAGGGSDYRRRFIQEGRAASALNHPNIITIYDVISQDGLDLMVMEFVAGQTLDDLVHKGGMPAATVLHCAVQMADALSAAHAAGIIHRDLKPGNVMLTDSGLVKILDFGLAKVMNPISNVDRTVDTLPLPLSGPMTVEGSIVGTVSYMSPEQAEGRAVDARSDVFAFGLTVYEMLTGERAFWDASTISTLSKILRDEAKPISGIVNGVPPEFEQIVNRALRKDAKLRWQTMQELHAALLSLKQRLDSAVILQQAKGGRGRVPVRASAAGILLAAGLGLGGWWWTHKAAPSVAAPKAAQTSAAPAPAADDSVLTNQSVVDMLQAKVPVSAIVGQIPSSATKFDLTSAELIRLTKAGATAELLEAMRNPKAAEKKASAPATVAPVVAVAPAAAPSHPVIVYGGLPLSIALTEDVPLNPPTGRALHFTVAKDFVVGGSVIVAKRTAVEGEIFGKQGSRIPIVGKAKPTFRVFTVTASDGSKLAIRAAPGRRSDKVDASIEAPGKRFKDKAAAAGSDYMVFVDGDQAVKVKVN